MEGMDIFNFFKGQSTSQKAMQAFFQSAVNGTMQVKDGFIQIGEAEKEVFSKKNGFWFFNHSLRAHPYKVA